jgi:hypothetical protein
VTIQGPSPSLPIVGQPATSSTRQNLNELCPVLILVRIVVESNDCALIDVVGEILKICLDVYDNDTKQTREKFLSAFYDHYLHWLLVPFSGQNVPYATPCPTQLPAEGGTVPKQSVASLITSRRVIYEILSHCVLLHSYRIKYFIIRNSVLSNTNKTFQGPYRAMFVPAIRFIRDVISCKDEVYCKHVVKFDILRPVVSLLEQANVRDNLITSAVLGLLEFVRKENIRSLVAYIVDKFQGHFTRFENDALFCGLKLRNEQNVSSDGYIEDEQTVRVDKLSELQARRNKNFVENEFEAAYFSDDALPGRSLRRAGSDGFGGSLQRLRGYGSDDHGYCSDGVLIVNRTNLSDEVDSTADQGDGTIGSEVLDSVDLLPPIRPKFEIDEAEGCLAFKTRKGGVPIAPILLTYSNGSPTTNTECNTTKTDPDKETKLVCFTMKKRPVCMQPYFKLM